MKYKKMSRGFNCGYRIVIRNVFDGYSRIDPVQNSVWVGMFDDVAIDQAMGDRNIKRAIIDDWKGTFKDNRDWRGVDG